MARILIAGCGYVGNALATMRVSRGDDVWGLRRHPVDLASGVQAIAADLAVARSLEDLPADLEVVVYAASPGGRDDAFYRTTYVDGLRNLLGALEKQGQRPRRVIFVSSTAVYGQTKGEWVDEDSPTEPTHFSGQRLLEAEQVLRDGPFPGVVLRLAGIYGPRRTRLIDQVRQGRATLSKGKRYTNRIHRDDCAGILDRLIDVGETDPCYVGVDHAPEEERVVLDWMAGILGAPPPRVERVDQRKTPRGGNKRCRNTRILDAGYRFIYPTYREGYTAVLSGRAPEPSA
ncbi:MAG: SDR family oxidoreductase [Myxococcota bacterium]